MPICSYVVLAEPGTRSSVARALARLPGCEVEEARNRDLLLLVTDAPTPDDHERLMERVEEVPGIGAVVLCFGEVDPDTPEADPMARVRRRRRVRLNVLSDRPDHVVRLAGSDPPSTADS